MSSAGSTCRVDTSGCLHFVLIDFLTLVAVVLFEVVIGGGLLVLLVFADEIGQVGLGLGEFHFVHTFARVPVQEGLPPEHGLELGRHTFEEFLDRGVVADECDGHFQVPGCNVTVGRLYIVGDPFDKVRGVLHLHSLHLVLDFFHRELAPEVRGNCEVAAHARI